MKPAKYALIGIITGFLNGFFGAGGGALAVAALEFILKMKKHKAHATAIAVIFPLTVISAVLYARSGNISWPMALSASLGGVVGGFVGARLLKNLSEKLLGGLFGAALIILAVKMIF